MIERPATQVQVRWSDWLITVLLFVGLSSLYYATASGITSSNDGSHYALLRTIIENRAFTLNQFDDYAEGNDIALVPAADGSQRLYSDRPPGTAVNAIPFYLLGNLLVEWPATLPSRHDAANPRLAYVLMLPALAGAGTAAILYWLLRHLGLSPAAALTAVIFFALGTVHWKYSSVLYSHALSGFLVLLAVYLALYIAGRGWVSAMLHFLIGLILGWAVVVEYSNVLLVAAVTVYLLISRWWVIRRRPAAAALPFLLGGLIPALFLAWYNTVNFGRPWTLSYAFAVNYPWASSLTTTFNFPLGQGLQALVVRGVGGGWCDGPCLNQGFLFLSPVLLLAIPGLIPYFRAHRGAFLLTTSLFLLYLFLFALHHTSHGFTADGRYLAPYLALLAIPLGYTLQRLFDRKIDRIRHALLAFLAYGLFFLSMRNVLLHIGYSYNYTLDLGQLRPLAAAPDNWLYFARTLFPNWRNLPLLWLAELSLLAIIATLIGTGWFLWLTRARRSLR